MMRAWHSGWILAGLILVIAVGGGVFLGQQRNQTRTTYDAVTQQLMALRQDYRDLQADAAAAQTLRDRLGNEGWRNLFLVPAPDGLRAAITTAAEQRGLMETKLTIAMAQPVPPPAGLPLHWRLRAAAITLEAAALDDRQLLQLIEALADQGPGRLVLHSITITRRRGATLPQPLVNGIIGWRWFTIAETEDTP